MPADRQRVAKVVREWLAKADEDLLAAQDLLRTHPGFLASVICFHAQQCVEKCLKALLIWRGVGFSRTHDIGELKAALPRGENIRLSSRESITLTRYAVGPRYPLWSLAIGRRDAAAAVKLARRVRRAIGLNDEAPFRLLNQRQRE